MALLCVLDVVGGRGESDRFGFGRLVLCRYSLVLIRVSFLFFVLVLFFLYLVGRGFRFRFFRRVKRVLCEGWGGDRDVFKWGFVGDFSLDVRRRVVESRLRGFLGLRLLFTWFYSYFCVGLFFLLFGGYWDFFKFFVNSEGLLIIE